MSEPKKSKSMSRSGDPNPMLNAEREPISTWDDPADHPGGSTSGRDNARPIDKEASQGGTGVVTGFNSIGTSGSASGRSLYGMEPEEEQDSDKQ